MNLYFQLVKQVRSSSINLINLSNIDIHTTEQTEFLGLTFDKKLIWSHHINSLKKSCSSKLNILKQMSHTTYETERSLPYTYRTLIRSKGSYGASIYSLGNRNSILRRLITIQYSALWIITGIYLTSLIISLLCENSDLLLNFRFISNPLLMSHVIQFSPNLFIPWSLFIALIILHKISFSWLKVLVKLIFPPWTDFTLHRDLYLLEIDRHITRIAIKNVLFSSTVIKIYGSSKILCCRFKFRLHTLCYFHT